MHTSNSADNFDVSEKLRSMNSHWSLVTPVQNYHGDSNYEFITAMVGETEFAIYKRQGVLFVLVDFFKNYEEACKEAKEIIDSYPDVKSVFQERTC